jgi:hypothetical protein
MEMLKTWHDDCDLCIRRVRDSDDEKIRISLIKMTLLFLIHSIIKIRTNFIQKNSKIQQIFTVQLSEIRLLSNQKLIMAL